MFSKACEYAIRAAIYISLQSREQQRASLKDIAQEIGSPEAFTAKILQQLVKNDIIESVKGPHGGFDISLKKMRQVKLSMIVYAIDGDQIYKGCGLGLAECSESKPCPVHEKFAIIRARLRRMLESTTLFELSTGLTTGLTFLKR